MGMIPRNRRGLLLVLAALSGMWTCALAQQPGLQAPAQPPVQQAPPQQQPVARQQPGAPQQPGAAEQPGAPRLGRPFPAPVSPPPPHKEEPRVYVAIVPPQESRVTPNRLRTPSLRNGGNAPAGGGVTSNGLDHPAGSSAFGQPVE
jgi:hypothetical protein